MLSDERIAEIQRFFNESGNCIMPRTAHNMALELLAELTRLRTREYREPTRKDENTYVWLTDDDDQPRLLRHFGYGIDAAWEFDNGVQWEELDNRLICPVEPKPQVCPIGKKPRVS